MGKPAGLGHRLEQPQEARVRNDHAGHRAFGICQHALESLEVRRAGSRSFGHKRDLIGHEIPAAEVGAQGLAVVRVHAAAHEHAFTPRGPAAHQGAFRRRGCPVVMRGRNHVHARQLGHHRLVFVDGLERALTDLGLVGRVGGVELAAQENLVDDRGNEVAVNPGAEEAHQIDPIALG